MHAKTLEALRGSIRKWEQIAAGTEGDRGPANCPLCEMFYSGHCTGCPVAHKTGEIECDGSPYQKWTALPTSLFRVEKIDGRYSWWVDSEESRAAAQAELDFLKSLLPKDSSSDEQKSIRDAGGRASAEATALEGDDSTNGSTTTEPAMESIAHATSGPEATSSRGDRLESRS
jgi:hypothetical protein